MTPLEVGDVVMIPVLVLEEEERPAWDTVPLEKVRSIRTRDGYDPSEIFDVIAGALLVRSLLTGRVRVLPPDWRR